MKAFVLSLLAVFIWVGSFAQGESAIGGGDVFTGNLKFYVVAAVLGLILLWIFAFLFSLEKKIKLLEDNQKK